MLNCVTRGVLHDHCPPAVVCLLLRHKMQGSTPKSSAEAGNSRCKFAVSTPRLRVGSRSATSGRCCTFEELDRSRSASGIAEIRKRWNLWAPSSDLRILCAPRACLVRPSLGCAMCPAVLFHCPMQKHMTQTSVTALCGAQCVSQPH